jgi:hypothetical protein
VFDGVTPAVTAVFSVLRVNVRAFSRSPPRAFAVGQSAVRSFPLNRSLLAGALATAAVFYACSDHHDGPVGPEGVVYEGAATDEAIVPLLAMTPKASASLKFTAPMASEMVPKAQPMTLSWSSGLALGPAAPSSLTVSTPGGFSAMLAVLRRELGVKQAHAHPQPFNGQGYYLRIEANGQDIVRVFTDQRSYTVTAELWQKLVAAGGAMRATLVSAFFEKNRITSDGGPYEAPAVTFGIAP